ARTAATPDAAGHRLSGQPVSRLPGLLLRLHVRAAARVWGEHPPDAGGGPRADVRPLCTASHRVEPRRSALADSARGDLAQPRVFRARGTPGRLCSPAAPP